MDHERENRRTCERVPLSLVGIEIGTLCTTGRVYDISTSGLRVEECEILPEIGSEIRVTFVLAVDRPAFMLDGKVVRHTSAAGFAVEFVAVEPRLRDLVQSLADRIQELPDLTPLR